MTNKHVALTIHIDASKATTCLQQTQEWLATAQKTKPEGIYLDLGYDPERLSQLLSFEEERVKL